MIGLRPKASELYLERPRLIEILPDEPGYVVWLEAPYGYGKSVLSTQWADRLESEGWRIFWLALQGRPVIHALTELLKLPETAPWGIILDQLWQEKTLLVLEDLTGQENLSNLFKHNLGLLLLASRHLLSYAELLPLRLEQKLIHIGAAQLSFSQEECYQLIADRQRADELWQRTQGWSLPLHFSALTGEDPEQEALLKGIENSLSDEAWQEALFLASLSYLPEAFASQATRELAKAGFVQSLEKGYRLHPLIAEALLKSQALAIQEAVLKNATRLSPCLKGEAFERCGLFQNLSQLLDEIHIFNDIAENPRAFLNWINLLKAPLSQNQRYNLAIAQSLLGNLKSSSLALMTLAQEIQADRPNDALYMLGLAAYDLAGLDTQLALEATKTGEGLLPRFAEQKTIHMAFINSHDLFLNNAAWAYLKSNDYKTAEQFYLKALEFMDDSRKDKVITLANLAHLRWLRYGDLEGYIEAVEAMIPFTEHVAIYNLPYLHLELGRFKKLLGNKEAAKTHFQLTQKLATNPLERLSAEAELAYYAKDPSKFSSLYVQVKAWNHADLEDKILALWVDTLIEERQIEQALMLATQGQGFRSRLSQARALKQTNEPDEAIALLPPEPEPSQRENYLLWLATSYQIRPDEELLQKLIAANLCRERILAGVLPFNALPADKPELAKVYPLKTVLASGWQAAIRLRLSEIPMLDIRLLGQVEARVLGEVVDLTDRHKEIICLMILAYRREEIGEAMWPDTDSKKVRNNLHVQLNLLRKILEPWGEPSYLFEDGLKATQADLWLLDEALNRNDAATVLALYQTPLAPGVELEALQTARENYTQAVIDCLYEAAQLSSDEEAALYLARVLELDPLYEEALQSFLSLLLKRGRRREAQRRYHKFAQQLKKEMELEPLAKTQEILKLRP